MRVKRVHRWKQRHPLTSNSARPRNLMLQRLPEDRYAAIVKSLIPVDLPSGLRLSEPNQVIRYAYFPVSGLVSVDALTNKGESVEVGVIGREGLTGLPALLGDLQMEHSVIMQGAGTGLRIRANILREEFLSAAGRLRRWCTSSSICSWCRRRRARCATGCIRWMRGWRDGC